MCGKTLPFYLSLVFNIDLFGILRALKLCLKAWAANHKRHNAQRLLDIESEIQSLLLADAHAGIIGDRSLVLKGLESERN
jgi:hypothetical protein